MIIMRNSPGIRPAAKSWVMLVPATMPYMIMGRLGKKSSPKLPEDVNNPRENFSEYFPLINAG